MPLTEENKVTIQLPKDLTPAQFIKRVNRFVAQVLVQGQEATAHVPSSGRMQELLVPGAEIFVGPNPGAKKRTDFKLLLVNYNNTLVSIDSLLPNRLLDQALRQGALPQFAQFTHVRREYAYGKSRLDFLLTGAGTKCLVEVKSVTLVENKVAMFPDAPSARGAKHLEELTTALDADYQAAVVFLIQRNDAAKFKPHHKRDPNFSQALRQAHQAGVAIYAWDCRVTPAAVQLNNNIPVGL